MGVHWTGIVFGLGFVITLWLLDHGFPGGAAGAGCAQTCARRRWRRSSASFFKMAVPFIVILPGLLALVVLHNPDGSLMHLVGEDAAERGESAQL